MAYYLTYIMYRYTLLCRMLTPIDVKVVGCMFYTLLVGKPPFDTEAIKSTLNKVIIGEYEIPTNLSIEAQDLIQVIAA